MSAQEKLNHIPCPPEVLTLVENFHAHVDAYKSGRYNETQLRREFVDPLFEALGWDMTNKAGHAEAYKDVIHEDAIRIESSVKAPDYCFRIGGTRKFFLETKKPSVYIKEEIPPAFQLRRYAWSAKLPLSILSDFEEFAVYDARIKPDATDKASTARILYLTYKDYAEKWHEIASIFSKDSVLKGSFDKYAETTRLKKGTATVDDAFLNEIEDWREHLAKNIALRNSNLSQRELNFAVQRTIDRIVFLRICEDRGIEKYGRLQMQLNGTNVYKRLVQLFSQADDRYNSGLFHFQKEKDRHEEPDKLTPNISIDDKPLKDIINRLYYPESPYEFSVLSADILGQVYEQFLGKVIRLTAGHQAKVEEKPEVRKAGGVYYTPKYIVDYIVKNTVGRLVGDQGSGIGIQGPGDGDRVSGTGNSQYSDSRPPTTEPHAGGTNANSDIQGPRGLAGSDELNNRSISPDENISEGRNLRIDQPNSAGSSLNTGQHSGGPQSEIEKRISSSRIDSAGLSGGTGNASDFGKSAGVLVEAGSGKGMGNIAEGWSSDKRSSSSIAFSDHQSLTSDPSNPTPDNRQLTPKQVSRLKILDPACGSGSFLLGAYQYLLDWHLNWYSGNDPEKWAKGKEPAIYQAPSPDPRTPNWHLTTAEKKRILLNNIYGVDIDSQAVEVTKLSLLLKVLEGENNQTLANQLRMFHQRALPDLGDNIKCGNSLIGPDFYQQQTMLDDEERYRINVFDWDKEFPNVFHPHSQGEGRPNNPPRPQGEGRGEGGFDAVIGNPPWGASFSDVELDYLRRNYSRVISRMIDSYIYFIDRAIQVVRTKAPVSFIIPSTILNQIDTMPVRELLLKRGLSALLSLGQGIFGSKVLNTSTIFISGGNVKQETIVLSNLTNVPLADRSREVNNAKTISRNAWEKHVNDDPHKTFFTDQLEEIALLNKLRNKLPPLSASISGTIQRGVSPDIAAAHVLSKADAKSLKLEEELLRPSVSGSQIKRFRDWKSDQFIIYTARDTQIKQYPHIEKYLSQYRHQNTCKEVTQDKHPWWSLHRPRDPQIFDSPKFVGLTTAKTIELIYDPSTSLYVTDAMYVFNTVSGVDPWAFLAIMQSNAFLFLYRVSNQGESRVIPQVKASKLESLPFPTCDQPNPLLDKISGLCKRMYDLNRNYSDARTPAEQTSSQRQIDAADQQINQLVYDLYGLTQEEIKIVSGLK